MITELRHKEGLGDIPIGNQLFARGVLVQHFAGKTVQRALGGIHGHLALLVDHVPFDPGPGDIGVHGDIVFGFTGLDAKTAAYAVVGVDQKGPAQFWTGRQHLLWIQKVQGRKRD